MQTTISTTRKPTTVLKPQEMEKIRSTRAKKRKQAAGILKHKLRITIRSLK